MKKLLMSMALMLITLVTMITPALALEYDVEDAPAGDFGEATTVEPVTIIGGGPSETDNINRSKDSAVIPPPFGSEMSNTPGTGEFLTPSLSSGGYTQIPATGGSGTVVYPGGTVYYPDGTAYYPNGYVEPEPTKYTLPDGLFYSDGSLGRLKIPSLDVSVKVYETESLESLAKGAGHFKSTSCWDGNVGFAAHNRGVNDYFGDIHKLESGDTITYTTQLGTRTYEVFFVGKISETDYSHLQRSSENMVTLITCVRNERDLRWCVQAREVD